MNEQAQLAEFADNLWGNYIKQKIEQNSTDAVTYFKAEVVTNNGDGTLSVKQPFDNAITVHCSAILSTAAAGDQVVVMRFGKGNNQNYLALCHAWSDFADIGLKYVKDGTNQSVVMGQVAENTASGLYSTAEGEATTASGEASHAEGNHTKATRSSQTVIGKYNALDSSGNSTDAAFVIGGGTNSARKDIFSVDWDGNTTLNGLYSLPRSGNTDYSKFYIVPYYSTSALGVSVSDRTNYFQALVKKICALYPNTSSGTFIGRAAPDSHGWYSVYIYNTSTLSNGLPQYSSGHYFTYEANRILNRFGTSNYTWWYNDADLTVSTLTVSKATVGSNTFADANPKIIFNTGAGNQDCSLTWTDYDSVQAPASLTLNGKQGGEYFIAPNIKATGNFYGNLSGSASNNVLKSGDTMSSSLYAKFTGIDASKANNNVSSTQYPTTFSIQDTAGRIIGRAETIVMSNGQIGYQFYVRNYNTSGGQVAQKGIGMYMSKDGTFGYTVSDPAKFRSAIGSPESTVVASQAIGTDQSTVASSAITTWTQKGSISLPAGTYWLEFTAEFEPNANGVRCAAISGNTSAQFDAQSARSNPLSGNAGYTFVKVSAVRKLTAQSTLYFLINQNSGSTLKTYGRLQYVKLTNV